MIAEISIDCIEQVTEVSLFANLLGNFYDGEKIEDSADKTNYCIPLPTFKELLSVIVLNKIMDNQYHVPNAMKRLIAFCKVLCV